MHYGPTRIYGPTVHAIGGTAQLALRSSSAAAIIAGQPRNSNESVAGRQEQLADVGRSDLELRGLNDYASTGSGPTRQSDARDSEPLHVLASLRGQQVEHSNDERILSCNDSS